MTMSTSVPLSLSPLRHSGHPHHAPSLPLVRPPQHCGWADDRSERHPIPSSGTWSPCIAMHIAAVMPLPCCAGSCIPLQKTPFEPSAVTTMFESDLALWLHGPCVQAGTLCRYSHPLHLFAACVLLL